MVSGLEALSVSCVTVTGVVSVAMLVVMSVLVGMIVVMTVVVGLLVVVSISVVVTPKETAVTLIKSFAIQPIQENYFKIDFHFH